MPYCIKCGAELGSNEKYCPDCGTPTSEDKDRIKEEKELIEEKIPEMKTIVYKTLVDPSTVKLVGEREKVKLFTKMGFLKPKSEDIKFETLEKFYDPYFIINGRYFIDYYRKHIHKLEVEEDVSEIVIFNQVLKPKTPSTLTKLRRKGKEVELEVEQRIIKENSAYLALNRKGQIVKVEELTTAPAEAEPEKVLTEAEDRVWRSEASPKKAIEVFRSRVVSRPDDAERITKELFEVSEYTLVFIPIYQATYKNLKTNQENSLQVNGVTSTIKKND
ncbi:zinc-ribbon domain-containing protein [Candidatus Bathyarchaeota archaeon]|nr:zinc-ribbon domain-containing protein [Candidatus Bathyarchaeota archaeon]